MVVDGLPAYLLSIFLFSGYAFLFAAKCSTIWKKLFPTLYLYTVELQWLEHLWNHKNMFETGVVRANEM